MEIWYSHVPPTHPVALCYVEFAKWYASTASANLGSWSVGIPNDPPYAVLVGLEFDLKQKGWTNLHNKQAAGEFAISKLTKSRIFRVFRCKAKQCSPTVLNSIHTWVCCKAWGEGWSEGGVGREFWWQYLNMVFDFGKYFLSNFKSLGKQMLYVE